MVLWIVISAFCVFMFFVNEWFKKKVIEHNRKMKEYEKELRELFGSRRKNDEVLNDDDFSDTN